MNTSDLNTQMDCSDVFVKCVPKDHVELTPKSERLFKASVIVVCGWALIETPLDLGGAINFTTLLALVVSKILMGLFGAAAIVKLRFARQVFMFICGVSVFAIAPALPVEYTRNVLIALCSTVECLGKAACVVSLAFASLAAGSAGEHLSLGNPMADD
ncbi:hypothetical protein [Paraburkholderia guartelaensis]|uniref:hypothetical protein n=1 Tax=Paraburkholderia guartelaensis TaxID=2546446 RepID=UPI002AB7A3FB|nr:hypothetical protein [Paraburkholderia guartelaensis]